VAVYTYYSYKRKMVTFFYPVNRTTKLYEMSTNLAPWTPLAWTVTNAIVHTQNGRGIIDLKGSSKSKR